MCRVDNLLQLRRAYLLLLILRGQHEAYILLWDLLLLTKDIVISFQTANSAMSELSKIFPVHSGLKLVFVDHLNAILAMLHLLSEQVSLRLQV